MTSAEKSENFRSIGVGDVRAGIYYQIMYEGAQRPDLLLSWDVKSNSGKSPYVVPVNTVPLGTGHWDASLGFKVARTIDPVVLFGDFAYTYVVEREIRGSNVKPGDSINLGLGTGFALNDQILMSFKTLGSYLFRPKIDGQEINTISTPFLFNISLVKIFGKYKFLEPSISFGISDDAPDLILGIAYIQRF